MKRYNVLLVKCFSLASLMFFILTSCGSERRERDGVPGDAENGYAITYRDEGHEALSYEAAVIEVVFTDADITSAMHGAVKEARLGTRRYFFPSGDEERNIAFIAQTEALISELANYINTESPIRIFYAQDGDISHVRPNQIFINHENADTHGFLPWAFSGGRLPFWLSVGLEAVIRGGVEAFPIGDLYEHSFAPFAWGTQVRDEAVSTAYGFVRFLMDNDYLTGVINAHLTRNNEERVAANYTSAAYFYRFSGRILDNSSQIAFVSRVSREYSVIIETCAAIYNFEFSFECRLDVSRLERYIDFIEDSIEFVKNWYTIKGVEFDIPPIFVFIDSDDYGRGALAMHGHMYFSRSHSYSIFLAPHEVSHVISFSLGGSPFCPFEEGLANVIQRQFFVHEKYNEGSFYQTLWADSVYGIVQGLYAFTPHIENQEIAAALKQVIHDSFNDPRVFNHLDAYYSLNHPNFNLGIGFGMPHATRSAMIYTPEIFNTWIAPSFVDYLIDRNGIDSYFLVHFNPHLFEEVYGIGLRAMVDEWLVFLTGFVQGLVATATLQLPG